MSSGRHRHKDCLCLLVDRELGQTGLQGQSRALNAQRVVPTMGALEVSEHHRQIARLMDDANDPRRLTASINDKQVRKSSDGPETEAVAGESWFDPGEVGPCADTLGTFPHDRDEEFRNCRIVPCDGYGSCYQLAPRPRRE